MLTETLESPIGIIKINQISIRQAQKSDTETVSSILQEARNWLVSKGIPLWKADELSPENIRPDISLGLFWLAEVEGSPVGCVRFQIEDNLFWPDIPPNESTFIHRLAVRREAAGGTVSRALIEWAKARTVQLGKRFLRLDCDAKTIKLCQFYEKAGFRKHSEWQAGPFLVARFESDLN